MANLKGTFLSDDNIRRMCPAEHLPPLGKTYALFGNPNLPNRLGQAPTDPKSRFLSISQLTGIPYKSLAEEYKEKIAQVPRTSISVVSMNLEGADDLKRRVGFMTSRGLMMSAGNQNSGTQNIGGSQVNTYTQSPLLKSFTAFKPVQQQEILKNLQSQSIAGGFGPIGNLYNPSQINQLNTTQRIYHVIHLSNETKGAFDNEDASRFL